MRSNVRLGYGQILGFIFKANFSGTLRYLLSSLRSPDVRRGIFSAGSVLLRPLFCKLLSVHGRQPRFPRQSYQSQSCCHRCSISHLVSAQLLPESIPSFFRAFSSYLAPATNPPFPQKTKKCDLQDSPPVTLMCGAYLYPHIAA